MMKYDDKLGKLIFLGRRLEDESMESKIMKFGSRFAEKSSSEWDRNFNNWKSWQTKIEIEIDSNYDSKLKSKDIRRKIRMKLDL